MNEQPVALWYRGRATTTILVGGALQRGIEDGDKGLKPAPVEEWREGHAVAGGNHGYRVI